MRIVFFIGHDGFLRNFGSTVRCLAERGHEVHLAMGGRRPELVNGITTAEAFAAEHPSITFDLAPRGSDGADAELAEIAQRARDYWFYNSPEFANSRSLRGRAQRQAPQIARWLTGSRLAHVKPVRRGVDAALRSLTTLAPPSPELTRYLKALDPDVALFTPLIYFRSIQYHGVRSARALGIPTGFLVHSWDNLSTKGVLHTPVDRVFVWNEAQRSEAVRLHGVDAGAVVVTGAQNFDHWFEWSPSRSRADFCRDAGLADDRPFLLYLCSSKFIARHERPFIEAWLRRIRECPRERVSSANVLVRPHPQWMRPWEDTDALDPGRAVVWPAGGRVPVDDGTRSDFFDSLYHASAVVGINTSALIEAAIAGRQTFTWLTADHRDSQEGTVHFRYLGGEETAGALVVASTFSEHAAQLDAALARPEAGSDRIEGFLRKFVRPQGLDSPATPIVVDAIERMTDAVAAREAETSSGREPGRDREAAAVSGPS